MSFEIPPMPNFKTLTLKDNIELILSSCGRSELSASEAITALQELADAYDKEYAEIRKMYWNERADHIKTEKERDLYKKALNRIADESQLGCDDIFYSIATIALDEGAKL